MSETISQVAGRQSMSKYLRGVPPRYRTEIRREAKRRGFVLGRIGPENKSILADAIFKIQNELEERLCELPAAKRSYPAGFGRRNHPAVLAINSAYNAVLNDLGWNMEP